MDISHGIRRESEFQRGKKLVFIKGKRKNGSQAHDKERRFTVRSGLQVLHLLSL